MKKEVIQFFNFLFERIAVPIVRPILFWTFKKITGAPFEGGAGISLEEDEEGDSNDSSSSHL